MVALSGPARRTGAARTRLRWAFGVGAAVLLAATGTAYLATSATVGAVVTTPTVSGGAGGAAYTVTAVSQAITINKGHAQQIAGLEAYRVDIANGVTGTLLVNFSWVDPQDAGAVLDNPNSWIQVGLYQAAADSPPSCASGEYDITDPEIGHAICVEPSPGSQASGPLTAAAADTVLTTALSGQSQIYLLESINVPGGAPQGAQGQLSTLQYYAGVQVVG